MRDYSFPLPPLPEQRAIAHILGTLDDKIELNRKMNETLEGIARALFKSWFVDFDPVRAKMDGKKPAGMDDETAELFPDELVWNEELGKEVPKGWGVKPFYECVNILSGGTPKTSISEYWNGDVPWVSARDVKNANGSFILEPEKTISESGVDHSNAKLLPKHTTVITARGTVGSYCILGREMTINQTNYGFKGRDGYPDFFVFFSLQNIIDLLKQHAYGTIFDTITRKTFQNVFMIKPCSNLIKEFEKIVTPLMESIHGNIEQGISLVAIRDTLLQKLISGQLRIEEPEMFLKGRGLWR